MAHKVLLDDLVSLTNETSATNKINENSRRLEAAIENTLSRDGTEPNAMRADLDMNSHRIQNLPEPISPTEPARLIDVASEEIDINFIDNSTFVSPFMTDLLDDTSASEARATLEIETNEAAGISFVPSGNISSSNVQAAIQELDAEKQPLDSDLTEIASGFVQTGTGAVTRTLINKNRDVLHVKDYGGVGDGSTDNTTSLQNMKAEIEAQRNGVALLSGGRYAGGQSFTSGTPIWSNFVEPLLVRSDKPSVMGLFEGNASNPDTVTDDPVLWVQKITRFDSGTDQNAQAPGGVLSEVVVHGSGTTGATETTGVWQGILGNAVLLGTNQGTEGSPDYDLNGSCIGVAGFARSEKPSTNPSIVTALWGYATTPEVTATEFANVPAAFSTVGLEINIENRLGVDPGPLAGFGNTGTTAGILLGNFPSVIGTRDWTFGVVFYPLPDDGNFSSTDPTNWHGFHDGIFIDIYKRAGVRFGRGVNTSSGILFPSSYTHANFRPLNAISLGDNVFNWGNYTGSTFNNGDMWVASNTLFYRNSGGNQFSVASVSSAVNRIEIQGAATGGLPRISAIGSDTDVSMDFTVKGNARYDFRTNSTALQLTILNNGNGTNFIAIGGSNAGAGPSVAAIGGDTNIDLNLTPKGTGNVRFNGGSFTANGASTTTFNTNLRPAAANQNIQEWLTFKNASGTVRYIPCW